MTRFAAPAIVQCPNCSKHVQLPKIASINTSPDLFPPMFQALLRGDVICPCCDVGFQANELLVIVRMNTRWQRWKWRKIPSVRPRCEL